MSTTSGNQAGEFLSQVSHISDSPKGGHDPDKGQVPFVSALTLTYEQETRMVTHALKRIEQMESEQGRTLVASSKEWFATNGGTFSQDRYTFMGRRAIWELSYQNKVWWRKWCLKGQIYEQSNLTAPFCRNIARKMTARAVNYFFGTDPWFAAYPIGGDREELAEELDEYCQFKTDRSQLKPCMAKAIEGAFVRGESVVKTIWETDEQLYQQNANVLTDPDGNDILDVNGDWITDADKFMDEMQGVVDPNTGKKIPGSDHLTGRRVLRRDLTTVEPNPLEYTQKKITRRKINFSGAKSDIVYWQDFLCPMTAPHIQKGGADIIAHLSDMPVIKLIDLYQRRGLLDESPSQQLEATQRAINLLRQMAANSGQPKTAAGNARADVGEVQGLIGWEETEPKVQIAECYMTFDANEDGQTEEIVCVIDRRSRLPVFYDYLPNVTPDGERPFDVVRVQPIEGRWYGLGAMEMFDKSQRTIDLLLNRWNLAQGAAGRTTFWKPSNTLEGDRNPHLVMNMGKTYTLKEGRTMEDTLGFVTLPEVNGEDIQKLMQLIIQVMTSEAGVASADDSAIAGLETGKLATGVRNIQQSGEEMFSLYIGSLEPCLESITRRNLRVEFANMKPTEVFSFFEGDQHKVGVLMQEDVADLDINVNVLLTRYKNQQMLQSAQTAINAGVQFYQNPPEIQGRLAKLYIQELKALGIDDPGSVISPMEPPPAQPQPGAPGQPAPAAGAPPSPGAASSAPTSAATQQIQPGKFLWSKPPPSS